jgi:hypothetical protein
MGPTGYQNMDSEFGGSNPLIFITGSKSQKLKPVKIELCTCINCPLIINLSNNHKQRVYPITPFILISMVSNCTYTCITVNGALSSPIKVHMFTFDGIDTYVVEPIGGGYGGKCGGWYDLFPSKRFDSLEEAMREVVELQHQPQHQPQYQPQHQPRPRPAFL